MKDGKVVKQRAFKEWICDACGQTIKRLDYYYAVWIGNNWKPKRRIHIGCLK